MAINSTSAQILATSSAKAVAKAMKTGKLNMGPVALYHLISYYAWYTKGLTDFNKEHEFLLDKLTQIKGTFPNEICNYKTILVNNPVVTTNKAPTAENESVNILTADSYQFTVGDFFGHYGDAESHGWKFLQIYPFGLVNGYLYKIATDGFTKETVSVITEYDVEGFLTTDNINLYYERNVATVIDEDTFIFRISDNPPDYLYSPIYNMVVSATAQADSNATPVVGDNTIYVSNRVETILTLAMFTTGTTAPYSDAEGDLLDAIRIDEISAENVGEFQIDGAAIVVNDIITREQINAGDFKHIGPDQDTVSSDVFCFSARDEGSLTWVQ